MESFYGGQAEAYDDFRKRLLKGREDLLEMIEPPQDAVWVDMGGGTGSNIALLEDRIQTLKQVYVVDLAKSLLEVAQKRFDEKGWTNIKAGGSGRNQIRARRRLRRCRYLFLFAYHDSRLVRGHRKRDADSQAGRNHRRCRLFCFTQVSGRWIEKARVVYSVILARLVCRRQRVSFSRSRSVSAQPF